LAAVIGHVLVAAAEVVSWQKTGYKT